MLAIYLRFCGVNRCNLSSLLDLEEHYWVDAVAIM